MKSVKLRHRYGKFRFRVHIVQLIGMAVTIAAAAAVLCFDSSRYLPISIIVWMLNLYWIIAIVSPHLETFEMDFPTIHYKKCTKHETVRIPESYTVILSPMEMRFPFDIQGRITKNDCVSIVRSVDLSEITARLHRKNLIMYTNATVKRDFAHLFVTDFIYDPSLPRELFHQAAMVIVPKSMKAKLNLSGTNVFYDTEF